MTAAPQLHPISVEDYLAGELVSPVKHEYVAGVVYAIAGARIAHNVIATNILGGLHGRLRGKRCRPYNSDMKIRIRLPTHWRFYYPDVSVICRSNPQTDCKARFVWLDSDSICSRPPGLQSPTGSRE